MSRFQSNALILFATFIWGSAFIAQKVGSAYLTPWLFTGLRFGLGAAVVALAILGRRWYFGRKKQHNLSTSIPTDIHVQIGADAGTVLRLSRPESPQTVSPPTTEQRTSLAHSRVDWGFWGSASGLGALLAGSIGAQQVGLPDTSVANAGFIAVLYVALVPLLGWAMGRRPSHSALIGAAFALVGLITLSGPLGTLHRGDAWQLLSVGLISGQILLMERAAPKYDPLALAAAQFAICAVLSLLMAAGLEPQSLQHIVMASRDAWLPLIYSGALSVGLGYTLQVVAQRQAKASDAALLFSLESVFAAASAWLILGEGMGLRALLGGSLVLTGVLASQGWSAQLPRNLMGWIAPWASGLGLRARAFVNKKKGLAGIGVSPLRLRSGVSGVLPPQLMEGRPAGWGSASFIRCSKSVLDAPRQKPVAPSLIAVSFTLRRAPRGPQLGTQDPQALRPIVLAWSLSAAPRPPVIGVGRLRREPPDASSCESWVCA